MKILFLSQRIPYPPNRGDKITTWQLVRRMKERGHDVTITAFAHDPADHAAAQTLRDMGYPTHPVPHNDRLKRLTSLPLLATSRPVTLGVYGSRDLQAIVDREMQGADMAYAYSSSMGAFLEPHADKPRIMHFGELDSDKWRQYAGRTRFPMSWVYRREHRTLLEFERRLARTFTDNVLCTPLEERIFQEQIPGTPTTVLRNGVDLEYFHPKPDAPEPDHLVFTGVMNYYPNVDGCIFFVNEVLPLIRAEFPGTRFTIIGAHPTKEVEALAATPGVTVTGFVDDTRDYMWRGSVAVAPLRIARGIQNKVLEAMALGLPVVGSVCATQGVGAEDGAHYLVRDDARGQADAILGLLRDPESARELGRAGRRYVEDHYEWDVCLRTLDALLAKCEAACAPQASA